MKLASFIIAAASALATVSAHSATITVGALTRVEGSATITDTLNSRVWLGADVTRGLTYAQTVAAIGTGGAFEGYSIARNDDARMYTNAMLAEENQCDATNNSVCGSTSVNLERIFGESYFNFIGQGYEYDYIFFRSNNGQNADVGLIEIFTNYGDASGRVLQYNEWADVGSADYWAGQGVNSIGWLLYRAADDSSDVPEPGSLAIFGLGLLAAAGVRRRKLSQ